MSKTENKPENQNQTIPTHIREILDELKKSPEALKTIGDMVIQKSTNEELAKEEATIAGGYIQRQTAFWKRVEEQQNEKFEKIFEDWFDKKWDSKTKEAEEVWNKAMGFSPDPPLLKSDMIKLFRQIALEKAETGKRTPASETPAGPEGNTQLSEVDQLFEKAKKGELA